MNRIKHKTEEVAEQKKTVTAIAPKAGEGVARKFINAINVFSYFDKKSIQNFMPFVFFLTLLAIMYIANSYIAERTIRDIDKTERDIKELRSEFITGKSELMYRSKLSQVATAIESKGLKESTVAPKKIVVEHPEEKSDKE